MFKVFDFGSNSKCIGLKPDKSNSVKSDSSVFSPGIIPDLNTAGLSNSFSGDNPVVISDTTPVAFFDISYTKDK